MDTLAFPFEIKSINDAGLIDGLAAAHGNVDYGGDRFIPGAFAKSLASSATVPMLLHHDLKRPIGAWTDLRETPAGLEVKGRIAVASRDGADARALVQAGALRGLSVGYHTLRKQMVGDVRELHEVKLHEISLVPVGMNERAVVRSVKTIASVGDLRELLRDHGFGGREAKVMAGAAWRAMGDAPDEPAADAQLLSILQQSTARIAAYQKDA